MPMDMNIVPGLHKMHIDKLCDIRYLWWGAALTSIGLDFSCALLFFNVTIFFSFLILLLVAFILITTYS